MCKDQILNLLNRLVLHTRGILAFVGRTCLLSFRALRSFLSWEVPSYSRPGLYLQALLVISIDAAWNSVAFASGYAVTILAFVAVVMTVRASYYKKTEQVVWVVIAFALMFTEIQVIKRERDSADTQRRIFEQNLQTQFNETARRLEGVTAQSNEHFNQTIGKIEQAINTETGGDTFCYIRFGNHLVWQNGKPLPQTAFDLELEKVGKYPLRDLRVMVLDTVKFSLIMSELTKKDMQNHTIPTSDEISNDMERARQGSVVTIQIGNLGINHKWLGVYASNGQGHEELDLEFWSFNSSGWTERAALKLVNGQWKQAILVELHDKRAIWTKVDKDYPHKDGHLSVDWPRPVKGRAEWDH